MSDRYKILNTINQEEYLLHCPIKIEKVQLLLDRVAVKIILRLKMFNLDSKNISAVYLSGRLLDKDFDLIELKENISYLNLDIPSKSSFGENNLTYLDDLSVYYAKVIITKVVFTDNSVWENETNDIGTILPIQTKISEQHEFYSQIQREFETINKLPLYLYETSPTYWRCNCGQTNPIDYLNCCFCSLEKSWLDKHLNYEYLKKESEAYNEFLINLKKEEAATLKKQLDIKIKEKEIKRARLKKYFKFLAIGSISILSLSLIIFISIHIYLSQSLVKLTHEQNKSKIQTLLWLGKNINEADENNQTALSVSLSDENEEMFDFLLKNGADITKPNLKDGKSIVDLLFENKDYKLLSKMISCGKIIDSTTLISKNNLMFEAVQNNDYEMVKFLIDNNLSVQTFNFESKIPLEISLKNHYDKITKLLLQH